MRFKQREKINNITDRERQLIELIAGGFKDEEISEQLGVSVQHIRSGLVNGILKKTETNNRPQLVCWALQNGVI